MTTITSEQVAEVLRGDLSAEVQRQVHEALKTIERRQTDPAGGYLIATKDGNGAEVKSFADFLLKVRDAHNGDGDAVKRLKEHYGVSRAAKTLNEGDGSEGGYTVPPEFDAQLREVATAFNPIDQLGNFGPVPVTMKSRTITMPMLDQTTAPTAGNSAFNAGVVAYWGAESATIQATEPKFRNFTMNAHKLSGYTAASAELQADTVLALEALLKRLFGQAIGTNRFYAFLKGSGVGKPLGVLNSPALISVSRATPSAVGTADLKAMYKRMIPGGKYVWMHHPFLTENLMDLSFGSNTAFAWGNVIEGVPNRLLGLPLYPAEFLSAPGTSGDLLLVDWTYYLEGKRAETQILMSEHVRWLNDETVWKFTHRCDGQPWLSAPITLSDGAGTNTVSPFISLN